MTRALVTGASSGIGAAIAAILAQDGHDLVLVARRGDRLEELATEFRSRHGVEVVCEVADLTDADARRTLTDRWSAPERLPDLLVNNAGRGMNGRFLDTDPDDVDDMIRLNVEAPFELCRGFGAAMRDRGDGAILNVASMAGFMPTPFHAPYSAAKAALVNLTEALRSELRPHGIRVTCLCPGVTDTEFFAAGRYVMKSLVYRSRKASPATVARAGLRGVARDRGLVVPGWSNRLIRLVLRVSPTWFVVRVAARVMNTD